MKKSFPSLGAKNVGVIVKSLTKVLMVQKKFWTKQVILYAIASRGCILPSFGVVPNS